MTSSHHPSRSTAEPFSVAVNAAMDDAILDCNKSIAMPPGHSGSQEDQKARVASWALPPGVRVRRAVSADVPAILSLVKGLAEYEKEPLETVVVDEATLLRDGFGPEPLFYVLLVERNTDDRADQSSWQAVGFGLFVFMYSTWEGRVMFLEDLYLVASERRKGIGRHLFMLLAKVAQALDCARFQWMALDWNTPALDFYAKLGAPLLDPAWRSLRMNRQQIAALAACSTAATTH